MRISLSSICIPWIPPEIFLKVLRQCLSLFILVLTNTNMSNELQAHFLVWLWYFVKFSYAFNNKNRYFKETINVVLNLNQPHSSRKILLHRSSRKSVSVIVYIINLVKNASFRVLWQISAKRPILENTLIFKTICIPTTKFLS